MAQTAFERAQHEGDRAIRTVLLDAASRLLAAEGARALTLRRIAMEVGCSTTVLYRMFGAKTGLIEALYAEGFRRFRQRLAAVPPDPDPRVRLLGLARAYRDNALLERNYYGLMFGEPIPGFSPGAELLAEAAAAFAFLQEAVAGCAAAGLLAAEADPADVAYALWSTMHGLVGLELAGHLPDPEAVLTAVLHGAASGFFTAPVLAVREPAAHPPSRSSTEPDRPAVPDPR